MSNTSNCDEIISSSAGHPPHYSFAFRLLIVIILSLVPVVSCVGNIVVILAIVSSKRLFHRMSIFIGSLAIADIGVAICVMPFAIYKEFTGGMWYLGKDICNMASSLDVTLCTVSILHLLCLSLDRYLVICHPFRDPLSIPRITVMALVCWFFPAFLSFLIIMNEWHQIGLEDYMACVNSQHTCVFWVNKEFAYVGSMIAFYIPAVAMGWFYWKIYLQTNKQKLIHGKLRMMTTQNREAKAARTVEIIMTCFTLCWAPFFILNLIDPYVNYRIPYVLSTTALWLGYMNSVMNPLLYYLFSSNFSAALNDIVRRLSYDRKITVAMDAERQGKDQM